MRPIEFVYSINGMALERVDEIKDLGVIMEERMSFLPHIEAIISKSTRILGFINRISRDFRDRYTHKTLHTSLVMRCVDCRGECGLCQLMMQGAF
jgi:hypothetical protein